MLLHSSYLFKLLQVYSPTICACLGHYIYGFQVLFCVGDGQLEGKKQETLFYYCHFLEFFLVGDDMIGRGWLVFLNLGLPLAL